MYICTLSTIHMYKRTFLRLYEYNLFCSDRLRRNSVYAGIIGDMADVSDESGRNAHLAQSPDAIHTFHAAAFQRCQGVRQLPQQLQARHEDADSSTNEDSKC